MKVYLVIDSGAYEGIHETFVDVCSSKEKAIEELTKKVYNTKCDLGQFYEDEEHGEIYAIDEDWEIESDTETEFFASKQYYSSHYFSHIWIEEREVI